MKTTTTEILLSFIIKNFGDENFSDKCIQKIEKDDCAFTSVKFDNKYLLLREYADGKTYYVFKDRNSLYYYIKAYDIDGTPALFKTRLSKNLDDEIGKTILGTVGESQIFVDYKSVDEAAKDEPLIALVDLLYNTTAGVLPPTK